MDVAEMRGKALEFFNRHRAARADYQQAYAEWIRKHGNASDQQILFAQIPQVQWALEAGREFGELALLYATMATMELNWEARELYNDMTKELENEEQRNR